MKKSIKTMNWIEYIKKSLSAGNDKATNVARAADKDYSKDLDRALSSMKPKELANASKAVRGEEEKKKVRWFANFFPRNAFTSDEAEDIFN